MIGLNEHTILPSSFVRGKNTISEDSLEHGWANFSDERQRFRFLYHLRPQSKLISNKHVVCSLAVDHCDMTQQVGMCVKNTFYDTLTSENQR